MQNLEQYLRTQRQVQDLREPSLMESHMAEYQRTHEDYQNEEEKTNGSRRGRRRREAPKNRTESHQVREYIKFELSDAKVPDKETEIYIQKQRALKEGTVGTATETVVGKRTEKRMTNSESKQVQVISEMRYGSPRNGRSPQRYYNHNSASKSPFKIVVPDTKPTQYKVYGSPSYNYPRYESHKQQQQQPQQQYTSDSYFGSKTNAFKEVKSLSDYPNKQWWLPISKKQRQKPQSQRLEQYSEQYKDPSDLPVPSQYITLLQSNILPASYQVQGIGSSNPNPSPKFAAVIYREMPTNYYTQTPKPITEDLGQYYVNPFGHPVRVEDVQIQTSEPDKHLGTRNEYVPIRERTVPFKAQRPFYSPETSTQASLSALTSLIGKRPIQQLQGFNQLLDLDRPQDSTSPVQFDLDPTTPIPPPATILKATPPTQPKHTNANIQYYQPKYETVLGDTNPLASLSQSQLNAVYNDLVHRHRNQEQRMARPPSTTARPQYYQYTTPTPIQVSHASVTLQTPIEGLDTRTPTPKPHYHRPRPVETKSYPPVAASMAISSTSFHRGEEDKVSTIIRTISHKKRFPNKRLSLKAHNEVTELTKTTTKHNIHKRELLRTRPRRRLTRQRLLVRPGPLTQPPPPPPTPPMAATTTIATTKVSITNPYEHDLFTISVDDFANAFDPKGLKEAFDLIGNQDIPANPFASAPAEDRQNDFHELEDLNVDERSPSYLRQQVLSLREKNNEFLKTINAAILYNDRNEEKEYKESSRKAGKSLKYDSMRKFDSRLNDNGSEEMSKEEDDEEENEGVVKPSEMENKLMTTLTNYIKRDPVKEQLLREIAEQIERQKAQEEFERRESEIASQEKRTRQIQQSQRRLPPPPVRGRRLTRRDTTHLNYHNETTPIISKLHVYTKTLTDPEGVHYNGTHNTDHSFDYNDGIVEDEKATLSVDYEDFSEIQVKETTSSAGSHFASRSDDQQGAEGRVNEYFEEDEEYDDIYYHDSSGRYAEDKQFYEESPGVYAFNDGDNNDRYSVGPYGGSYGGGQKFKYVPVTVFKKVPVDQDDDESLHIDNVNIFESSSHGSIQGGGGGGYHGPPRRPPKKYRIKGKGRWHSRPRPYRHRRPLHGKKRRRRPSKLRKKFPKIKWLLEH